MRHALLGLTTLAMFAIAGCAPEPVRPVIGAPTPTPTATVVAGAYTLCTTTRRTSYRPYQGLELRYAAELAVDGGRVMGTGVKDTENGAAISGAARTRIEFRGGVDSSGRLTLDYTERGVRRDSEGRLDLARGDSPRDWEGTFESDIASSSGGARFRAD